MRCRELLASWGFIRQFSGMNRNTASAADRATRQPPALRRAYFDCRFGQLHVHQAIPAGGGFDEATAVICLPAPGEAAAVFAPLLAHIGGDRSMFAIDLPGYGLSDGKISDDAALAVGDFVQSMRLRQVNFLVRPGAEALQVRVTSLSVSITGKIVLWGSGSSSSDQNLVNHELTSPAAARQIMDRFDR
jgi:hypothetical protein